MRRVSYCVSLKIVSRRKHRRSRRLCPNNGVCAGLSCLKFYSSHTHASVTGRPVGLVIIIMVLLTHRQNNGSGRFHGSSGESPKSHHLTRKSTEALRGDGSASINLTHCLHTSPVTLSGAGHLSVHKRSRLSQCVEDKPRQNSHYESRSCGDSGGCGDENVTETEHRLNRGNEANTTDLSYVPQQDRDVAVSGHCRERDMTTAMLVGRGGQGTNSLNEPSKWLKYHLEQLPAKEYQPALPSSSNSNKLSDNNFDVSTALDEVAIYNGQAMNAMRGGRVKSPNKMRRSSNNTNYRQITRIERVATGQRRSSAPSRVENKATLQYSFVHGNNEQSQKSISETLWTLNGSATTWDMNQSHVPPKTAPPSSLSSTFGAVSRDRTGSLPLIRDTRTSADLSNRLLRNARGNQRLLGYMRPDSEYSFQNMWATKLASPSSRRLSHVDNLSTVLRVETPASIWSRSNSSTSITSDQAGSVRNSQSGRSGSSPLSQSSSKASTPEDEWNEVLDKQYKDRKQQVGKNGYITPNEREVLHANLSNDALTNGNAVIENKVTSNSIIADNSFVKYDLTTKKFPFWLTPRQEHSVTSVGNNSETTDDGKMVEERTIYSAQMQVADQNNNFENTINKSDDTSELLTSVNNNAYENTHSETIDDISKNDDDIPDEDDEYFARITKQMSVSFRSDGSDESKIISPTPDNCSTVVTSSPVNQETSRTLDNAAESENLTSVVSRLVEYMNQCDERNELGKFALNQNDCIAGESQEPSNEYSTPDRTTDKRYDASLAMVDQTFLTEDKQEIIRPSLLATSKPSSRKSRKREPRSVRFSTEDRVHEFEPSEAIYNTTGTPENDNQLMESSTVSPQ